jgi:hypothetical protein
MHALTRLLATVFSRQRSPSTGVTDELALPTISMSKTGDDPSFKQLDVSAEFAKRITEDFAILRCADLVAALCAW